MFASENRISGRTRCPDAHASWTVSMHPVSCASLFRAATRACVVWMSPALPDRTQGLSPPAS
jgi:hypothetical protein